MSAHQRGSTHAGSRIAKRACGVAKRAAMGRARRDSPDATRLGVLDDRAPTATSLTSTSASLAHLRAHTALASTYEGPCPGSAGVVTHPRAAALARRGGEQHLGPPHHAWARLRAALVSVKCSIARHMPELFYALFYTTVDACIYALRAYRYYRCMNA